MKTSDLGQQVFQPFPEGERHLPRFLKRTASFSLLGVLLFGFVNSVGHFRTADSIFSTLTKIQKPIPPEESYRFHRVWGSFGGLDLDSISGLKPQDFRAMVLSSTPRVLRKRLESYISEAFHNAVKYQIDPFWILAIMWTESHFKPAARSRVDATGLMQIMPVTGHYLSTKMRKPVSMRMARELIKDPRINIEMGTFYLRQLLRNFKGSYRYATVAYNMGPTRVRYRLRNRLQVGVKNHYLNKVRRAYRRLSKGYRHYLFREANAYKKTLVISPEYFWWQYRKSPQYEFSDLKIPQTVAYKVSHVTRL